MRGRHWRAAYVAPPPEGFTYHVTLRRGDEAALSNSRVAVLTRGLPGGSGPLGLPAWLPQERVAWRARTVSILPVPIASRESPKEKTTIRIATSLGRLSTPTVRSSAGFSETR
jgi:hypothetical protein